MFLPIRREGQTVSRMQEVDGGRQERVLAVDEHGNESWVPPERLTGNGEAEAEQPRQRRAAVAVDIELDLQPETTPENTTTSNDTTAVDEEAVAILPQQPAGFFSTFAGACTVFTGLFWAVGQFIIGPSIWAGLLLSAPNLGPVMSILAVLLWWGGYWWYIHRVYYPGRPWVPVLDTQGQPQLREVDGQQFVYSQKECGLPRVWKKTWVPIEAFPVAEEEDNDEQN